MDSKIDSESSSVITTGVDRLLEYLKGKDLVELKQAARDLGVPVVTLQSWTDFLVEENIVGVEYKFTSPFIYLIEKGKPRKKGSQEKKFADKGMFSGPLDAIKNIAEEMQHPKEQNQAAGNEAASNMKTGMLQDQDNEPDILEINEEWDTILNNALEQKKPFFYTEAKKRGLEPDMLWEEYKKKATE